MEQVKRTQEEVQDGLAPPDPETPPAGIKSLAELPVDTEGRPTQSLAIVIQLIFLEKPEQKFTVEEIYNRLLNQFPGLTRNGPRFQVQGFFFAYFPSHPHQNENFSRSFPASSRDQACIANPKTAIWNIGLYDPTRLQVHHLQRRSPQLSRIFATHSREDLESVISITTLSRP